MGFCIVFFIFSLCYMILASAVCPFPNHCCRTTSWKQCNAAFKALGSLPIWMDKCVTWFAAASGKRARSPKFSDVAIEFCLMFKNLFGLALCQATGLVESVLQLSGLTLPKPDCSTLSRRQQTLNALHTQSRWIAPAG